MAFSFDAGLQGHCPLVPLSTRANHRLASTLNMFTVMDTAVASSTTQVAGVAVAVTSAGGPPSSATSSNGGGATLLSPASSSTQLNAAGEAAASMEPLRQALQDAVRLERG